MTGAGKTWDNAGVLLFINVRRPVIGCGAVAVLAVVLAAAGLTWLYLEFRPDELVIENRLPEDIRVGANPAAEKLCEITIVRAHTKDSYRGNWLCNHPAVVEFRTSMFIDTCTWEEARRAEPVVVTTDGANCSTRGPVTLSPPMTPVATPVGR